MPRLLFSLLLAIAVSPAWADVPAPRTVDVAAPDGTRLKATYYAAGAPGPGVLLLHMCNTNRQSWDPVGRQLSAAGIHALALDYRGFGDSPGARYDALPPAERQKVVTDTWPGDIDAALAHLIAQPGVDRTRIGAGGGSCGVNNAVQLARRHPNVRSLVLLAGATDRPGREYLQRTRWLPIFAAAAADDQFDAQALLSMRWFAELSGNPRNRFVGFADGRHGTEIFGPHPELVSQIVEWFADTLVKTPADPTVAVAPKDTPMTAFWRALDEPGGVARAVEMFREARQRDPQALLFPEAALNQVGYERLQGGQTKDAIELFTLNVQAYPASANAQDSLGDGYLADGQNAPALAAARKALELLPADKGTDQLKDAIRQSAQGKIDKLTVNR